MINYGTTLHHSPDGTTYTQLTGVVDIDPGTEDVGMASTTHLTSPSATMTFEAGFINPGELNIGAIIWDKAVYTTLRGFLRLNKFWKITYADGSKLEHQGFINALGKPKVPAPGSDDEVTYPLKIKQSGPSTYTAAA